jgi:hypothetical protein
LFVRSPFASPALNRRGKHSAHLTVLRTCCLLIDAPAIMCRFEQPLPRAFTVPGWVPQSCPAFPCVAEPKCVVRVAAAITRRWRLPAPKRKSPTLFPQADVPLNVLLLRCFRLRAARSSLILQEPIPEQSPSDDATSSGARQLEISTVLTRAVLRASYCSR